MSLKWLFSANSYFHVRRLSYVAGGRLPTDSHLMYMSADGMSCLSMDKNLNICQQKYPAHIPGVFNCRFSNQVGKWVGMWNIVGLFAIISTRFSLVVLQRGRRRSRQHSYHRRIWTSHKPQRTELIFHAQQRSPVWCQSRSGGGQCRIHRPGDRKLTCSFWLNGNLKLHRKSF